MVEEFEYIGKAMGTDYSISVICRDEELANKIYKIAKNQIEEYENIFSRFLPASELSLLNKNKKMIVSTTFLEITQKAYSLFVKTRGIFNPLVSVERFGYDREFLKLNKNIDDSLYDIDFSSVIIDEEKSMITLGEGQKLDYGGFLKGYLADLISKKIIKDYPEVSGIIINIGGDIHTEGLDSDGNRFIFSIYNPISKKEDIKIELFNQSLATSGIYKRTWFRNNKRVHHILDSSGNKNPETDIVSVSVRHEDGAFTEAYTKVFLSMDDGMALKLLDDKNISFIIIKNNGQIIKSADLK